MTSKQFAWFFTGSLLAIGAIFGVMQQNASTNTYSTVLSNNPISVVEEKGETIFLELPTSKQDNKLNRMLEQPPGSSSRRNTERQEYIPKLINYDQQQNKQSSRPYTYQQAKYEEGILNLISYEGKNGRNVVVSPNSGTPELISNPSVPSQKVFERDQGLYILDANTLQVRTLDSQQIRQELSLLRKATPSGAYLHWARDPVWSPDGMKIAFTSNRDRLKTDQKMSVWVHDVANGQEYKVSETGTASYRTFGWTPSNKILAENTNPSGESSLVAINPDTKQTQQIANGGFVAQSDDYQTVVYSKQLVPGSATFELYALSLSTGTSQLLYRTTTKEFLGSQTGDFSTDGVRFVTDLMDNNGTQILFIYNLQTKLATRWSLPPRTGKSNKVQWVGNKLLVPMSNSNPQNFTSETRLISVQ